MHTLNNISRNAFRGENEHDHVTIIDVTFASNPALLYFQTIIYIFFHGKTAVNSERRRRNLHSVREFR